MNQLGIKLDQIDGWPPYDVEHLWATPISSDTNLGFLRYKIKSIPFFVSNLALDDEISAKTDKNGYVEQWTIISRSGNSTLWVIENDDVDMLDRLEKLGCIIEKGPGENFYAVNIPPSVLNKDLDSIVDDPVYEGKVELAFAQFDR